MYLYAAIALAAQEAAYGQEVEKGLVFDQIAHESVTAPTFYLSRLSKS